MTPAIFGLAGPVLTGDERDFFRDADPAGYILFARNVENREQLRALTDELRAIHGRERLLVSIDQEGGRVARMKPPEWEAFPPGEAFAKLWQVAPASAIEAARANAELGHDLSRGSPVDYLRCSTCQRAHDDRRPRGTRAVQVAALGRAVLDGLARAGVAVRQAHAGFGRACADSHRNCRR
jgi:beta-N-acetylhexosaminidase